MKEHVVPEFTIGAAFAAIGIAIIYILLMGMVKEPTRQKINALAIAGAGGVYWNGGLGVAEFVFGIAMFFIAYKGLSNYTFIGIGWLMHTAWDVVHHLYANPIVAFSPSSSAGCAVCDSILAIWFFFGAPSLFYSFQKIKATTLS